LQRSLKQLSDSTPGAAPAAAPTSVSTRAGTYAELVAASIPPSSSVLRYSHRLALLRSAPRFGLNRFEGNLAIAAVMHRRRRGHEASDDSAAERSFVSSITTFVLVQGAVLLGAWWTLFR
jgi:hypothetical protein